ncbi:MAG TPA: hypothetical protein VJ792_09200 [Candidatus Nitrosotalea sp.]|nr:hypothetical protein [Candidatus Nitrosotalea sp.]
MSKENSEKEANFFEGLIESLADKHSQLDINFQKTNIKLPGMEKTIEIDGLVTFSVHVRELTEEEKKASSKKNVVMMTPKI